MKQPIDRDQHDRDRNHWRRTPVHVSYPAIADPRQTQLPLKSSDRDDDSRENEQIC